MVFFCSALACALILGIKSSVQGAFVAPNIKLPYVTLSGSYSEEYNITYYRKVPFVAPPVGNNRWRAPQPPESITNGTYDTDRSFAACPQSTNLTVSEDCLYLGIYSRPWTKGAKRPVVVEIHGGAYAAGFASFNIPPFGYPTLNASTENDFIFVYPAYRLNAFGFLPGQEMKNGKDTKLNAGLLDQQAALLWVRNHIEQFGGDPNNVAIWGQSAGGGSVIAQTIANGGETKPKLFSRALASSPYWTKTYRYDAPEAEWVFTSLSNLTGCSGAKDQIACMREVDYATLYNASTKIPAYRPWYTSSSNWSPVIDGEFLQEPLSVAVSKRKTNVDVFWGFYNSHEGERFVSTDLSNATTSPLNSSAAGFDYFLRGYLPHFSKRDLEDVKKVYPPEGMTETFTYNTTIQRAGLIFRDTVLSCPGYWLSSTARKGWQGEYTIPPAVHVRSDSTVKGHC